MTKPRNTPVALDTPASPKTPGEPPGEPNPERLATLRGLMSGQGDEVISRRIMEGSLIMGVLVVHGGLAWGVASLAGNKLLADGSLILHPALIGVVASVVVSELAVFKVKKEHESYKKARKGHIDLITLLAAESGINQSELPEGLKAENTAGPGFKSTNWILRGSAIGASAFMLSILVQAKWSTWISTNLPF